MSPLFPTPPSRELVRQHSELFWSELNRLIKEPYSEEKWNQIETHIGEQAKRHRINFDRCIQNLLCSFEDQGRFLKIICLNQILKENNIQSDWISIAFAIAQFEMSFQMARKNQPVEAKMWFKGGQIVFEESGGVDIVKQLAERTEKMLIPKNDKEALRTVIYPYLERAPEFREIEVYLPLQIPPTDLRVHPEPTPTCCFCFKKFSGFGVIS